METRRRNALNELLLLKEQLKGAITNTHGLQMLELGESAGNGQVHCVCLGQGLMAFEFDLSLHQDSELLLENNDCDMVYLFYCLKGNCFHKFKGDTVVAKMEEFQTATIFNDKKHQSKLLLKKAERLVLNCIRIDTRAYESHDNPDTSDFNEGLIPLLKSYQEKLGHFHIGKFNLEIGELIKMLENVKFADSISSLNYFHGVCHMILAKQLDQFKEDLENGLKPATTLLKRELEMINEVVDFIDNYPELQHSIQSISLKSGLSPSKLQLGFKFMHNMTLGEYIRTVRLKKAEYLIRTTDLNISEVVYSIGFTSRSYFCKIFKKKYNCNPKSYKQRTTLQKSTNMA